VVFKEKVMSDARATETKTPASWEQYPEYKKFWDAYIDIFWGEGGNTSYHQMLLEDQEWLRDVYLQNNTNLTNLEKSYINEVSGATGDYISGMEKSKIGVRGPGPRMEVVPPRVSQNMQDIRDARLKESSIKYLAGQEQAGRIKEYGEKFTPNAADMQYLTALKGLADEGQALRTGASTTTSEADIDTPITDTSNLINLGAGALGFLNTATGTNVGQSILGGIETGGRYLWDRGSDFIDWAWDSIFGGSSGPTSMWV
jgi:hypothetical protein